MSHTRVTESGTLARERRRSRRFSLAVPVLFRWASSEGDQCQSGGFTRDVSSTGTYITCDELQPALGSPLAIVVLLPSLDAQKVGLKLKAAATVVRVGEREERKGFAVITDFADDENRLSA
jgi:hypothetical protein